jgi:hypothetical protein
MQTGFQQPHFTQGFGNGSPFADPPRAPFQPLQSQPTGYNSFQPSPLNPQATGVNRFLPPALAPQPTGFMPSQSTTPIPPMPPMPSMPQAQPLVPQKTGPPPTIKFGVQPAKKLTPQPTGRANLANASKYRNTSLREFSLTMDQRPKIRSASKFTCGGCLLFPYPFAYFRGTHLIPYYYYYMYMYISRPYLFVVRRNGLARPHNILHQPM